MTHSKGIKLIIFLLLMILALPAVAQSDKDKDKDKKKKSPPTGTPVLWREPVDIQTRNLLLGVGGEAMKPNLSKVTFVEDRPGGYSKKYLVQDASGNKWVAKLGKEAQPDTAANRLLWAVG